MPPVRKTPRHLQSIVQGFLLLCAWVVGWTAWPCGLPAAERQRYPGRSDIPPWWQQTRAFYCPLANSGAGSSLMKFRAHREEGFESFLDMDRMLEDARALGTNVIYLVDYWQPDYEHKAEYRPKSKWGGDAAFRRGIEKVHRRGGRVIVYLEAFIISRDTELGRTRGPAWVMKDRHGNFYSYYDTGNRFYLMYPGRGSGWADYLVGVAGRLAREFQIDGVHLDSYGLQWGWRNYHPDHPGGDDPQAFNRGAVELVERIRAELRKYRPEAVVILEGAEHVELLEVCDGAQIESLPILMSKPWAKSRRYPIFTSSFSLQQMQEILDAGHNLALSPWWLKDPPGRRDRQRLLAQTDKRTRFDQIEALHRYHNVLRANGLVPDPPADFDGLFQGIIAHLNTHGWGSRFDYPPLADTAARYLEAYGRNREELARRPQDVLREMLAGSRKPKTGGKAASALVPFHTGVCQMGKDHVLGEGHTADQRTPFAIYAFLVVGPRGEKALVDLGPETLGYVNRMFRAYGLFRDLGSEYSAGKRYPDDIVQPENNVFEQLRRRNVSPEAVDHVVFTHLHADHHGMDDARDGGAAEDFPAAMLHVSATGWKQNLDKRKDGAWNSYVDYAFGDFLLKRQKQGKVRFADNVEIFPGLRTMYLGGHSPCSQAVIVTTSEGPAIIASDEVYLYRLLEDDVLPRIRTSEGQYRRAVDRLVDLAVKQKAILIAQHDPIVWETYRKAGAGWLRELRQVSDRAIERYLQARQIRSRP